MQLVRVKIKSMDYKEKDFRRRTEILISFLIQSIRRQIRFDKGLKSLEIKTNEWLKRYE
jgi:hypothetical protein